MLHKADQRAKWESRIASRTSPLVKNERGFIIETDSTGRTTLRDPGDWHKRRNQRFSDIANGRAFVSDVVPPEKRTPNRKR